jgi:hypothetical protein
VRRPSKILLIAVEHICDNRRKNETKYYSLSTKDPEFNTWASDRTKCQDWYKHPKEGKVVKR